MNGARLLLTPKWLFGHLLAAGLIALFLTAGFWQLDRLDQRLASNALTELRMEREPAPLRTLLRQDDAAALEYRRATVEGTYQPGYEILLRSKVRGGEAGWHVLTPLLLPDGHAVLVDRGWVPYQLDEPPVEEASPPAGTVEVVGYMHPGQVPPTGFLANFAPRDPVEGELERAYYVDLERLQPQIPWPLEPAYLSLIEEVPAASGELPLAPQRPVVTDQGSHLGYAVQWFSFALIGVIGYALLLRKVLRDANGPRKDGGLPGATA